MRTLAIETSCDDTSLAIVSEKDGAFLCEGLVTNTQILHNNFGGVMPELASRAHADVIIYTFEQLLEKMNWSRDDFRDQVDCISVTMICGLPGSLVIGKTFGYFLSQWFDKPIVEVNHIHGHLLSVLLDRPVEELQFPMTVLSVSGGHSDMYRVAEWQSGKVAEDYGERVGPYYIQKIGTTRDDAAGEAFDKVARMLGGPYPGGKWIGERAFVWAEKLKSGKAEGAAFAKNELSPYYCKRIMLEKDTLDFSFSGMKSQVSNLLQKIQRLSEDSEILSEDIKTLSEDSVNKVLSENIVQEICYEFQEAMTDILTKKMQRAIEQTDAKSIALVGGVSANLRLREKMTQLAQEQGATLLIPNKFAYCMDNGAMIGVVGLLKFSELVS